jgi:hypothetical protein
MVGRKRGEIPGSLARGRDRFEAWRRAVKLADASGPKYSAEHQLPRVTGVTACPFHAFQPLDDIFHRHNAGQNIMTQHQVTNELHSSALTDSICPFLRLGKPTADRGH